ncbi:MAG: class I SAM-dependent methyltransferase [Proteobacteria bacterium]|nr:class I SAM-dependent methyltransferase [Pseudomonadota bacterium]
MSKVALLIKSEGTAMLDEIAVEAKLSNHTHDLVELIAGLESGVNLLRGIEDAIHKSLVRVERGIISRKLFNVLYPRTDFDEEIYARMEAAYIGNSYALLLLEVEATLGNDQLFRDLQYFKGKMSAVDPKLAVGLRGYLLQRVLEQPFYRTYPDRWLATGNFVHVPDNAAEHALLFDHVHRAPQDGNVESVYDVRMPNSSKLDKYSIWDIYRMFDQSQFLTDHRTEKEAGFINKVFTFGNEKLLDIACGSGRIALRLAKYGYEIHGLDQDGREIAQARRESASTGVRNARFEVGTYTNFYAVSEDTYDGAFMIYAVLNMMDDMEVLDFLKSIATKLKPGGKFVIDLLNKPYVQSMSGGKMVNLESQCQDGSSIRAQRMRTIINSGDAERTTFDVTCQGARRCFVYEQRLFDEAHFNHLLKMAGFVIEQTYGSFGGDPYHMSAKKMIILANKV